MMRLFSSISRSLLAVLFLFVLPQAANAKDASSFSPRQQEEIGKIVEDYLVKHPEVIVKAINALQEKQAQEQASQAQTAIAEQHNRIFSDPTSFVGGNPKGDVTLVEFFDYQCGYCKRSLPELLKLLQDDKKVRVIFKEYPILSAESVVASKAALASVAQGKYFEFHKAMMAHKGALDDETIYTLAASVGLDVNRLKKDMASPKFAAVIASNHALADALGVNGTPAFIIGDTFVGGAMTEDEMLALVKEARAAKK